jgi:hypothetical protein
MEFSGVTMTGGFSVLTGASPVVPTDTYWANVSFLSETTSTDAQTNNTFLDGSSIAATVTRAGASSVSLTQGSYSPYPANNTTSYSAATNGGSGVFNGDNYLSVPANSAYAFGTGDFTVEFWVNFNSIPNQINPFIQASQPISAGVGGTIWWIGYSAAQGGLVFNTHGGGGLATHIAWTPTTGTWYNIAVTRASGTLRMYINGVQGTLVVDVGNPAQSLAQNGIAIGAITTPYYLNGYMSDVRIVTGTALYTGSTFTVPTSPLTAVSGTTLLLNYTNAGLYDARANSVLISAGSAQVSTTVAKWSPTSAYFNGSSSYLYGYPNAAFAFGTGDFTVEGWVYFDSVSGNQAICQSDAIGNSTNNKWFLNYSGSTNSLQFGTHNAGGFFCTIPFTPSTGTWYYVTAVRSSGTIYMFVDGVSGTVTTTGTPSGYNLSQNGIVVGGVSSPPTNIYLNGYIQDLRLTKGVARYTATFTPPTAALPTSA